MSQNRHTQSQCHFPKSTHSNSNSVYSTLFFQHFALEQSEWSSKQWILHSWRQYSIRQYLIHNIDDLSGTVKYFNSNWLQLYPPFLSAQNHLLIAGLNNKCDWKVGLETSGDCCGYFCASFEIFGLLFLKMGQPRPLLRSFSVFSNKQHNFCNKSMRKYVHPVYSTGIRTHNLSNMSCHP